MLLRLTYLGVTNAFALLRLLPVSDRDKDAEILALRRQVTVLERQLGTTRPRFSSADRAFLAALLRRLPRDVLGRFRLLVRPDTVLRWQRDLLARHHAARSRPRRPGRPRTVRSIRQMVLRLARENHGWGYRRIHGELLVLGIKAAASTGWEILHDAGIDPAPERISTTWADFLRSQADAMLACDFFETVTVGGSRLYVLAVIEHATRRIRILGATPHPTASWVAQAARNLVMGLEDAGSRARFLIRDRDGKFPALFDDVLTDAGIEIVLSGGPDAENELDHGTVGADLPPRAARPDPDLEPGAPAARPARVRAVLQLPPAASGDRERPATARAARTDPGTGRRHLPSRLRTRLPRRHSPRVPPCRLTCTDDIFGKHSVEEAITACQNAADFFQETGDRHGEATALNNLGLALQEARRFEEAITAHQDAAAIFRETGDQHYERIAMGNLAAARAARQA